MTLRLTTALLVLSLLMPAAFAQRMYDSNGRALGRVDAERFYNASGQQIGRVDAERVYDASGRQLGRIDGDRVYNASGRQIGRIGGCGGRRRHSAASGRLGRGDEFAGLEHHLARPRQSLGQHPLEGLVALGDRRRDGSRCARHVGWRSRLGPEGGQGPRGRRHAGLGQGRAVIGV